MRHILLVDDDPAVCATIIEIFQEWPETAVLCVADTVMAAQTLRKRHFDLALIDGSLPGVTSLRLAAVAANENTPVLLLIGCPDNNQTTASLGVPYLTKPIAISELLLSSRDALIQVGENVARVKTSVARLQAAKATIELTMACSSS